MDYPDQVHTVPYSNTALCPYCQRVIAVMPIPGRVNSADALGVTGLFRLDFFNCSFISSPFVLSLILLFGFLTRSSSITFITCQLTSTRTPPTHTGLGRIMMASTSTSSRAAVRSMAASLTASRASSPAVARSALAFAARSPASVTSRRALSSSPANCRLQQFPRLQSLNTLPKRTFATTGRMVCAH